MLFLLKNRQTYLDNISLNNLKEGGPDLNSKQVNPQFIKHRFQSLLRAKEIQRARGPHPSLFSSWYYFAKHLFYPQVKRRVSDFLKRTLFGWLKCFCVALFNSSKLRSKLLQDAVMRLRPAKSVLSRVSSTFFVSKLVKTKSIAIDPNI